MASWRTSSRSYWVGWAHISGDAFIDDKWEHVHNWGLKHGRGSAFLMDQPYTKGVGFPRWNWATGPAALIAAKGW